MPHGDSGLGLMARKAGGTTLLWLTLSSAAAGPMPLARFVQDALAGNAAVLAAEARLRAQTERRAAAERSYDNPELSIDTEEDGTFGGGGDKQHKIVVGVAKPLDIQGKRRARITVAQARRLVAQAELDHRRALVASELLNALAQWWTASARVRLLATHQEAMANFEALAERRRVAGDISRMEADLATLTLAEARMRRAAAGTEQLAAAEGVRRVTFADDITGWPTLEFELPPLIDTPKEAVSDLPVVRAAMLNARVAAALVEEADRDRRPNPTLSLGVGRNDGVGLAELGLSVPLAVLDRGSHAVSAAAEDAAAAARDHDDVLRRALVRFEASAERYRLARRAWRQWLADGAGSVDDREALARRSWEVGELDAADYLVHVGAAVELRVGALDLRQAALEAWFEWLLASGRIDRWLGNHDKNGIEEEAKSEDG